MKKFFTLISLVCLCAMNVMAEDVDLTKDMFKEWTSPVADAVEKGAANCAFEVGTSCDLPYGNGSVIETQFADLAAYDKLVITVTEGTPRPLFNRDEKEGQAPDHLIDLPNNADQTAKYVTSADGVFTYDLAKIREDYGYVHLHAIKGAAWQKITVTSMKLIPAKSVSTSINTVAAKKVVKKAVKKLVNGKLVIVNGTDKYNVAGQLVK